MFMVHYSIVLIVLLVYQDEWAMMVMWIYGLGSQLEEVCPDQSRCRNHSWVTKTGSDCVGKKAS